MNNRKKVGSYTAKGGFENEEDIVLKFVDFKHDNEAQDWLKIMGYHYKKIKKLTATQISPRINKDMALNLGVSSDCFEEANTFKKADIQIRLEIVIDGIYHIENLSLKKSNIGAGFNQVDKRSVDTYQSFWNIPISVCNTLKLYTGEIRPNANLTLKDSRRMFLDEIDKKKVDELLVFFSENKVIIFNDILRGRGALSADWMLVTRKGTDTLDWVLRDINFVCNFFSKGRVEVTNRGNLKVGRMTVQRKGGTPDPESLQFKFNPLDLFEHILDEKK